MSPAENVTQNAKRLCTGWLLQEMSKTVTKRTRSERPLPFFHLAHLDRIISTHTIHWISRKSILGMSGYMI